MDLEATVATGKSPNEMLVDIIMEFTKEELEEFICLQENERGGYGCE